MTLSRRELLFRTVAASGAAAASALPGCAPDLGPAPSVDVAAPVGGKIMVPLALAPELARDGGAVIVRSPGVSPILLTRVPTVGSYAATSATCTHQGCPLGVDGQEIVCPCHLARFGFDGAVHHPPARAALLTWLAELDPAASAVVIDLLAGDPGFPALVDGKVVLPFSGFPQLEAPGGVAAGRPRGYGRPIAVLALADGGHAAVDTVCTHLACTVAFSVAAGELVCPCHGSRFATDGGLLHGPARRGLTAFAAVADATGVTVTIPA